MSVGVVEKQLQLGSIMLTAIFRLVTKLPGCLLIEMADDLTVRVEEDLNSLINHKGCEIILVVQGGSLRKAIRKNCVSFECRYSEDDTSKKTPGTILLVASVASEGNAETTPKFPKEDIP